MKLNVECIRSVMLQLEETLSFTDDGTYLVKNFVTLEHLCKLLPGYTKADIFYSLYNLDQAGYISASIHWGNGAVYECSVNHMTYAGHEFLDKIRDGGQWDKIKRITSAIRNYSLSAIFAAAEGITNAAIAGLLFPKS